MTTPPTAKRSSDSSASPQAGGGGRKLSNFLCFAIYSANLAFGRAYKPILDEIGLTYTQYIALVALSELDDQTVGELGEKMFLESNTLTPILKKLEQIGFINRRRDPADERQVRVSLTSAGRALLESDPAASLADATGLGDDFDAVQKNVTRLRDNLLHTTRAEAEKP
ncbi:MarR family transcriptional regulator [Sinorhizobium fredii USDA 205]|uniref:MarR family transcriptional regulator n=1 Tax=Rhizobium fredii TaxID=380 RepID=A0A844AEF6_RHIFR|nr:MarR family transcriptional regulator [Sinorhizobium fredii]ASY71914.1 Organic hydroperoxide resistance transcriptional regulator [Sinorhizobium fredii CCBAU 83666]KSV82907.1 MarR family transcriptional regulator [Sinorhizobium fredii USDA 205]MQW94695.1 MarR family transcriptional regulator [Sinorhizobium fredii]MQX11363.1 MarR family transcriptional regulator [Sinorhizobium fredii]UTY46734.1 MarR family transcriptional regulator [Sinorhizobium fredii]